MRFWSVSKFIRAWWEGLLHVRRGSEGRRELHDTGTVQPVDEVSRWRMPVRSEPATQTHDRVRAEESPGLDSEQRSETHIDTTREVTAIYGQEDMIPAVIRGRYPTAFERSHYHWIEATTHADRGVVFMRGLLSRQEEDDLSAALSFIEGVRSPQFQSENVEPLAIVEPTQRQIDDL